MTVSVNSSVTPTFPSYGPFCQNAPIIQPILPTTSNNGIAGTWSPASISTSVAGNIQYNFTPNAGQCTVATSITVVVNPELTPAFTQVAAICSGGTFTLPTTSNNAITGTWSPAINNTTTTTYTFTPTAGQCATTATMTVTVTQPTTPTFTQVSAICTGGSFSLPTTSNNAITGTWSPAINNTATTTYTFTPTAGQCAATTTMTVTVTQPITPTFTQVSAICTGGSFSLPTTSNNAITGTWSPAINNTATTTYTFTPTAGQCATTTTMTVAVNSTPATPTFTQVAAICTGGTFTLPTTSNNAITGTWSPAINNTATTTYTFTPTAGQCATTATMTVSVGNNTTPAFTQVAPICAGGTFTLPTTSNNAIAGTWSPAINNTATATYTFTPTAGQCATATTMTVVVTSGIVPTFASFPAICKDGDIPTLPNISNNGIAGTWNPSVVSNQNSNAYTFTPTSGGCVLPTTVNIVVFANPYGNVRYPTVFALANTLTPLNNTRSFINATYLWAPGVGINNTNIANPDFNYNNDQDYTIQIKTNDGCAIVDTQFVKIFAQSEVYIPNAFTPNGDGLNDVLRPIAPGIVSLNKFAIFNRWGEKMFETSILGEGWDGAFKNKKQPMGNYVWIFEGVDGSGKIIKKKGYAILIR